MDNEFLAWLHGRIARVADLEARGKALIASGDGEGYRTAMREKAELLASLDIEGRAHLAGLPEDLRDPAREGLRHFAASAANALSMDSTFYMSALLFPEDHRTDEPNDLERFRDALKAKL